MLHDLEVSNVEERSPTRKPPFRVSPPPEPIMERMSPQARPISSPSPAAQEAQPLGKTASRERISREEVHRRLMNQRSSSSPVPDNSGIHSTPSPSIFVDSAEPSRTDSQPLLEIPDMNNNRLSVLTSQTDFSIETAILETAEKRNLGMGILDAPSKAGDNEFGLLDPSQRLQFDFGSKFSLGGLGISSQDTGTSANLDSSHNRRMNAFKPPSVVESVQSNNSGIKMGDVDVDMDMKSALDRLMEDVAGAGAGARAEDSIMTDEYDESYDQSRSCDDHYSDTVNSRPKIMERAATDSVLLQQNEADGIISRTVSGASAMTTPPPVPPKDNIKQREQIILEKRREARRLEAAESDAFQPLRGQDQKHLGVGRPSRRRSMSTGDAEVLGGGAKKRGNALLDIVPTQGTGGDLLADSIEKEFQKLVAPPVKSVSR